MIVATGFEPQVNAQLDSSLASEALDLCAYLTTDASRPTLD
jgi:hypothetical protein